MARAAMPAPHRVAQPAPLRASEVTPDIAPPAPEVPNSAASDVIPEDEWEQLKRQHQSELKRSYKDGLTQGLMPTFQAIDDLRRALEAAEGASPITEGVVGVLRNLERSLGQLHVVPLGRPGEPFDPHLHEAIGRVPTQTPGLHNTIAHTHELGYIHRNEDGEEQLLRPAKVVVYAAA